MDKLDKKKLQAVAAKRNISLPDKQQQKADKQGRSVIISYFLKRSRAEYSNQLRLLILNDTEDGIRILSNGVGEDVLWSLKEATKKTPDLVLSVLKEACEK